MLNVSIVVLNWNGEKDTIECLQSLEKLSIKGFTLSILLVDNGSSIKSIRAIKEYVSGCKNKTKLIENGKNLGFAGGNNIGIKHAIKDGADYVMTLNNDIVVDKNLVLGLLNTMESLGKVGIVSPKIYFAKGYEFKKQYTKNELGNVIWYAGGNMDWENIYGSNNGVDEVDKGQFDKVAETDFATGACSFINVKALKETGYFDEKYFMYFEDADLSQRMKRKGWKVLYSPKGYLWHKVAQSSGIGSVLNDYFITRNRLLFGLRYAKLRTKIALIKESVKFLLKGRKWQKIGVRDFYLRRFGRGSWKFNNNSGSKRKIE